MQSFSAGSTPNYKRIMIFVDGSNFLIQLSKVIGIEFRAEKPPFAALELARNLIENYVKQSSYDIIRSFWFASYQGTDTDCFSLQKELRKNKFEPVLFKKKPDGREKGVDIALAKEMLINAFNQNYDIAFLIAGDEDYSELIQEVKRYGSVVNGLFFRNGLSNKLEINFDDFSEIQVALENHDIKHYLSKIREVATKK